VVVIAGAAFSLRKLCRWIFPIRVSTGCTLVASERGLDSINATVTNRDSETIYIVRCFARGTYPRWVLVRKHLANPFLAPRLYPNLRYGAVRYDLLGPEPLRLEPLEQATLRCELPEHPLNAVFEPMFHVVVELSNGRRFGSNRMTTPGRWKRLGFAAHGIENPTAPEVS
jgi:hypothetical protein